MKKFFLGVIIVTTISLSFISCSNDENFSENEKIEAIQNFQRNDSIAGDTGGQDGNLPTKP